MNYTIVGFFDRDINTENVVSALKKEGIKESQIDNSVYKTDKTYENDAYDYDENEKASGFWNWLFGDDHEEKTKYSRVGAQSHLITVYAHDRAEAERASALLDQHGAIDINETFMKSAAYATSMDTIAETHTNIDDSISVVKEDLAVGKREVSHGSVQVRSRIIEKPVEESIRLREERVYVTRKPVDRKVNTADAFREKEITLNEYAEEAVVEKTAKVVEEISVGKDVDQRTETITDTVRETEVDIDDNRSAVGHVPTNRDTTLNTKTMNTTGFSKNRLDRAFVSAEKANEYYDFLINAGYSTDDINVLLSEKLKKKFYALNDHVADTGDEALKGAGAGSAIGGTVGAIVGAVAAIGSSVIIPGIGLAIAGPLAAALTGAGAGGATGALVGALTKAGLSSDDAEVYESAINNDEIIISVNPKDGDDTLYTSTYGREIYNANTTSALS